MVSSNIPQTLTEAQMRSGYSVLVQGAHRTQSNTRVIPYAEIYSGRSSLMETPAQHLQKVVEEEKGHKTGHGQEA